MLSDIDNYYLEYIHVLYATDKYERMTLVFEYYSSYLNTCILSTLSQWH